MRVEWPSGWEWLLLTLTLLHLTRKPKGDGMSEGINELTKLVDIIVDAIQDGVAVMADGKIDITDLSKLSNLVPDILAAVPGLGQTPAEIADLTFDEGHQLVQHVVQKLGVSNARALGIIEASLKLAAASYELIIAIKSPSA
jgi:hypothetical protein